MTSFNPTILQMAVYRLLSKMMISMKMEGKPEDHIDVAGLYDELSSDQQHGRLTLSPKTPAGAKLFKKFNEYMKSVEREFGSEIVHRIPTKEAEVIK